MYVSPVSAGGREPLHCIFVRYCERMTLLSSSKALGSVHSEKSTAPPEFQNASQPLLLLSAVTVKSSGTVLISVLLKRQENSNDYFFIRFDVIEMP